MEEFNAEKTNSDLVQRIANTIQTDSEVGHCSACEANQQSGNHPTVMEKPNSICAADKRVFLLPASQACSVLGLADTNDPDSLSGDMIGCLLFHHLQQMSCNVHAITAIVTSSVFVNPQGGIRRAGTTKQHVSTREQKRIASAIYPTASLLNHACDPDVIVRWGMLL